MDELSEELQLRIFILHTLLEEYRTLPHWGSLAQGSPEGFIALETRRSHVIGQGLYVMTRGLYVINLGLLRNCL
jgi:hypothetical protein